MKYNPEKHHRRSIRLKGYNYSQPGMYFITICANNRECLFGNININNIGLNSAGKMIEKWWFKLEDKFCNIRLDQSVIMPNHIHGIIEIINNNVGANPCIRPDTIGVIGANPCIRPDTIGVIGANPCIRPDTDQGRHIGLPLRQNSIPVMIQWFKIMTTNEYIKNVYQNRWQSFHKKLWQRNYYDRIVRNENELNKIRQYIIDNPKNWEEDENNLKNLPM